ncbi:MAG: alpha/beta hydrolase [Proteobacteria bacterium]|nr:alpha/beta hydrolase [Pseudomonadota bacterium]
MRFIVLTVLVGCARSLPTTPLVDSAEAAGPPPSCEGFFEADYADEPATFSIDTADRSRAIVSGYITAKSPGRFARLVDDNPQLRTLVMPFVPGSANDEANIPLALSVHNLGLDTCVPSTGLIASGGVDLFLAGNQRTAPEGARVGVHSWATGGGVEGGDLAKDHPDHDLFLDYYEAIGVDASFYWFTLQAAPSDDIHWMTRDEVRTHRIELE